MASKAELAEHLFTSPQTIDKLRRDGVIPSPRGRAGYKLDDCRRVYLEHLRARARAPAGDPEPDEHKVQRMRNQDKLEEERARLAAEQADKAAMENAIRRREVAPVAVLESYAEKVSGVVRSALEALPAQCKRRIPHLRASEINLIKQECTRASDAIADFDVSYPGSA